VRTRLKAPTPSPNISSLFSELSSRDVPANLAPFETRESQDIALPVPGAMNLGHFETWEGKGDEVNETAVEAKVEASKRTNPVEKPVTL
jgi:hypothetical protein